MSASRETRAALLVAAVTIGFPTGAAAQGCEPIRFTTPVSLGGEGEAYQPENQWRVTLAYRRLLSNQWFIGTERADDQAPGGVAPRFSIHTVLVDVAYSFSDRFRARVSVPWSTGSFRRIWPDGASHEQRATGIGDLSVQGEAWILDPRTHSRGNIGVGLGVKAPTGNHTHASQFYTTNGPVDFPADQTIQPGDGGWAILTHLQGFGQVSSRTSLYGFASYMISPKERSDVTQTPTSTMLWSVPDVYSLRAGAAYDLLPDQGLTVSLGARVDGIPKHDLIGGGDEDTIKRTSYVVFVDPGLSLSLGMNSFTLSVPWRVKVNRTQSLAEETTGGLNAGGFAKYLVFASYSRRF